MKANNLSISIPSDTKCKKNCPYCISKMTGPAKIDPRNFMKNLDKVKTLADHSEVSSVIITGKTEPLQEENLILVSIIGEVFKDYPLEIQTNGLTLTKDSVIQILEESHINTIAVSIDKMQQFIRLSDTLKSLDRKGFNVRVTINITSDVLTYPLETIIDICKLSKVSQLSFRRLTVPKNRVSAPESDKAAKYISEVYGESVTLFLGEFENELSLKGTFVRSLPFGASLFMYEGLSCTSFENCIQEEAEDDNIRSLIYYEDGHLSTSWYGSNFGRIF